MRLRSILLLALIGCAPRVDLSRAAPATLQDEVGSMEAGAVERVVDGDTLDVRLNGGVVERVRLLGIDAPESVAPNKAVECFGPEASSALAAFVNGRSVLIVRDVEDRDSFGRLLRYVYVEGEMANARLIVNGYASIDIRSPNLRHASLLRRLEEEARALSRGLWGSEGCGSSMPP